MQRPALSLSQIEQLERGATERELLLLRTLYETGCTVTELVNLTPADLHPKPARLTLPQKREINISSFLAYALKQHTSPYFFSSRESKQLTPRRVEQLLAHLGKRILGCTITPQQLRRTRIIHDFLNHLPIKEIEAKVGIQSIQPYLYAHFTNQEQRWQR